MKKFASIAIPIMSLMVAACDRPITVKLEGLEKAASQPSLPIGRYQAIALPKGSSALMTEVLILDTRDGDLWEWTDSPSIGAYKGGLLLQYMGRLTPGSTIGDVIQRKGF